MRVQVCAQSCSSKVAKVCIPCPYVTVSIYVHSVYSTFAWLLNDNIHVHNNADVASALEGVGEGEKKLSKAEGGSERHV